MWGKKPTKEAHQKMTQDALDGFQAAIDDGRVIRVGHKTRVLRSSKPAKRALEISYSKILHANENFIAAEVDPAYGEYGQIAHQIGVNEIITRSTFGNEAGFDPNPEDIQILEDLDERNRTEWMFSTTHPSKQTTLEAIWGMITSFFLTRKAADIIEQVVIIPAKIEGQSVQIITRGDTVTIIDPGTGEVAVDNLKTSRIEAGYLTEERVRLDIAMLELTSDAIKHGRPGTHQYYRNGEIVSERAIISDLTLDELRCRRNPKSRIVCRNGVLGEDVIFDDEGEAEKAQIKIAAAKYLRKRK